MELKIRRVGPVSPITYRDRVDITIPLSTRFGHAALDLQVQEEVVDAGTENAHFQLTVTVLHRVTGIQTDGQQVLLERTLRTDEIVEQLGEEAR